jgi:uncharacterized protein YcbK (DUF882 family)
MKKFLYIVKLTFFFIVLYQPAVLAGESQSRFFYSGNGKISLRSAHTKIAFNGIYRNPDGTYRENAIRQIDKVFGATGTPPETISLRLIEFLNYLKDKFGGKTITIASGYRSPAHNMSLRENGALAGKASLHQYGMAADIQMAGISSQKLWEYVRELGFGGAGYYHGKNVHLDVGPARWWDEKTSKVGTDIADDNKVIMLTSDRDIYLPGETIILNFARMTAWPIGVEPEFRLEKVESTDHPLPHPPPSRGRVRSIFPSPLVLARRSLGEGGGEGQGEGCRIYNDIPSMLDIQWHIPNNESTGRYRIRATFCEKSWDAMPAEITTSEFIIHHRDTENTEKK